MIHKPFGWNHKNLFKITFSDSLNWVMIFRHIHPFVGHLSRVLFCVCILRATVIHFPSQVWTDFWAKIVEKEKFWKYLTLRLDNAVSRCEISLIFSDFWAAEKKKAKKSRKIADFWCKREVQQNLSDLVWPRTFWDD